MSQQPPSNWHGRTGTGLSEMKALEARGAKAATEAVTEAMAELRRVESTEELTIPGQQTEQKTKSQRGALMALIT